jgi:hypothetical protein
MKRYTKPADGRWHGRVLRSDEIEIGGNYRLGELPFGVQFTLRGRKTLYSTMTYAGVGPQRYGRCVRDCWNEVEGQSERINNETIVIVSKIT